MATIGLDLPPVVRDPAYWLEWLLENWARWMRGDALPEGVPSEASGGFIGFVSGGYQHGESYDKMDLELAEATNSAINGLDVSERIAIYNAYGVAAVFRFRCNVSDILTRAKQHLQESLRRRGIWMNED